MGCIHSIPRENGNPQPGRAPPSKTEVRYTAETVSDEPAVNEYTADPAPSGSTADPADVMLRENPNDYAVITDLIRTVDMQNIETKGHSLVIAIDFGTTYSAYAYAHVEEKLDIRPNKNWEAEGCSANYKTPTCLCVAEQNPTEIHSFGLNAQQCSTQDDEENNALNLKFFDQFKMKLYAANKVNRDMKIYATGDNEFCLDGLEVFAMAIKFLKDHCLEHIKETGINVDSSDIMWVLTVPAIWKDNQKMFMREAAVKAGIIQHISDQNMMIALEPEAASLYCLSIYNSTPSTRAPVMSIDRRKASRYATLLPRKRFMIVDAGGGTVDITAYECLEDGRCKEVISPVGGAYGGKFISENFKKLLKQILGERFMDHLAENYKSTVLEFNYKFETAKRKCNDKLDKSLLVEVGHIATVFEEFTSRKLSDHFKGKNADTDVTFNRNSKLVLPPPILQELFDPVVQQIVRLVKHTAQKRELENISMIFLVGGFSQCAYLEKSLRDALLEVNTGVRIVKPEEPIFCVLRGAVMCGVNPKLIESRIAPRTYLFPAQNPDGTSFFSEVIRKGSSIPHGHVETKYVQPESAAMQYVQMDLYATTKDPPYHMSDKEITKICQVRVKCIAESLRDSLVEFGFTFGGTEIKITGSHDASNTKETVTVDFLCPS